MIGVAEKIRLRIGTSQSGDDVYCLGLPKVGPEISNPEDPEIVQVNHIRVLLESLGIHDIIPVGSRGIRTEAQLLAFNSNSRLIVDPTCRLDLDKSAGPSTCVLFTSSSTLLFDPTTSGFERLPVTKIGKLD